MTRLYERNDETVHLCATHAHQGVLVDEERVFLNDGRTRCVVCAETDEMAAKSRAFLNPWNYEAGLEPWERGGYEGA